LTPPAQSFDGSDLNWQHSSRQRPICDHPVKDRICSIYRDDRVRVQLGFNSRLQLVRLQTDMKPYRMLRSEWLGFELDWGK
jgi:hypothetical protein